MTERCLVLCGTQEYYGTMPWLAIPNGDPRKGTLSKLFGVEGIPSFALVHPTTAPPRLRLIGSSLPGPNRPQSLPPCPPRRVALTCSEPLSSSPSLSVLLRPSLPSAGRADRAPRKVRRGDHCCGDSDAHSTRRGQQGGEGGAAVVRRVQGGADRRKGARAAHLLLLSPPPPTSTSSHLLPSLATSSPPVPRGCRCAR